MKNLKKLVTSTLAISLCASLLLSSEIVLTASALEVPTTEESLLEEPTDIGIEEPEKVIIAEMSGKRSQYDKHFRLSNGSMMAVQYSLPVHFTEDGENWVEYDNRLDLVSENDKEFYKNRKSDIDISLSKISSDENMVSLDIGEAEVGWGYADANDSVGTIVKNDKTLEGNDKFTVLQNIVSRINYENIYQDVDAEYYVSSVGVKENLVLKSDKAQRSFNINYNIGELSAKQTDEHTITLMDNDNEVYTISAPFMTDADGDTSDELSLSIITQNKGQLSVLLQAKDNFFDENCSYPVVVDPYIKTKRENQLESTFANSYHPNDIYGGENSTSYIYTGAHNSGRCYSFVQIAQLPTLNSGDVVVHSTIDLSLNQITGNFVDYPDLCVNAYEVINSWDQSGLTWNNKPSMSPTVLDYNHFTSSYESDTYSWDITNVVKKWYNGGNNNGIGFKNSDDPNSNHDVKFYSLCTQPNENLRPLFVIQYVNDEGIEDYLTYSSFDVGTAGTAYVNNYTGNLVFIHNGLSLPGNNNFTLQHIFNWDLVNDSQNIVPYTVKGWKMNIQQKVDSTSNLFSQNIDEDKYPYYYVDGDGTIHFFVKVIEDNVTHYYDEDSLGLELTVSSLNSDPQYIISDISGNTMTFDTNGMLSTIEDSNDNIITIGKTNSGEINSVTASNSNDNYSKTISISNLLNPNALTITDSAFRIRQYKYTNNRLTEITDPYSTYSNNVLSVKFVYDTDGSLLSITDTDHYRVKFNYVNVLNGKKISSIQEYGTDSTDSTDGTQGQKISFNYNTNNTTDVHTSGVDGVYGTSDDIITTYQFDNYGRTISSHSSTSDSDIGYIGYGYTGGEAVSGSNSNDPNYIKNLNRINKQHFCNARTYNYLKNSNMEVSGNWTSKEYNGSNTFSAYLSNDEQYYGNKSYKIVSTYYNSTSGARIYQDLNSSIIQPGKTYTLSAYVKVTDIYSSELNRGAGISAASFDSNGTATTFYSDLIENITDESVENGWRRLNITFTVPNNSTKTRINLFLRTATGTVYFDGVQLEAGDTCNKYNLVENAGFENISSGTIPDNWSSINGVSTGNSDSQTVQDGSYSFKFTADQLNNKVLFQNIEIIGHENDTYILSGWIKSSRIKSGAGSIPGYVSDEMIIAKISYSDGSIYPKHIDMAFDCIDDWQFCSGSFDLSDDNDNTNKTPISIIIFLISAHQANDCYFDNIQLIRDSVQTYSYDNGNLVGYSENDQAQNSMEYVGADMTKYTDAKGYDINNSYDNNHNRTETISQTGVSTDNVYDSYGNVISSSTIDNSENDDYEIKTEASYTNDGLYVSQISNEEGNATTYSYDSNTGNLTSFTDSTGTTNYTYNSNNDLPLTVSKDNTTVSYGYTNGSMRNLTSVSNGNVSYALSYDKFNNLEQANAGSNTLASYTYGSNNGSLNRVTYGNGNYVDYFYNEYGSVNEVRKNGVTAYKWKTDKAGNATRYIDIPSSKEYNYIYDGSGRVVGETIKGLSNSSSVPFARINYSYDLNNNVSKIINTAGSRTITVDYDYQEDNLLNTVKINNDKTTYYSYDSLNRLSEQNIDLDNDITTSYTYKASERNTGASDVYQTTKIEFENINGKKYKYTYTDSGNIARIYEKNPNGSNYVLKKAYTYDSKNQLTKVSDFDQLTRTKYTYDNYGNIVQIIIYEINANNEVVSTLDTITYQYTDSTWGDKLTSYDGNTITYDAIGNPLSYRNGMTFTWNGRELSTFSQGSNSVSYTYDADGLRTTKTVNNTLCRYEYVNGQLLYETKGSKSIHYIYDGNGNVLAANYKSASNAAEQTYYYAHNWRGDVVALYDSTGTLFATYDYDAWGKLISVKDASGNTITSDSNFAILNSIRYRGYYYDTESGLYYLQSRYYDPTTGRFVNADSIAYTTTDNFVGVNIFSYSDNNFVNKIDTDGGFAVTFTALISMAVATVATVGTAYVALTVVNNPSFQNSLNNFFNKLGLSVNERINFLKNTISKSISFPKSIGKIKQANKPTYWEAELVNKKVVISKPISFRQACNRVSRLKNVMCSDQYAAKAIVLVNSYRNAVGPEKGCGNDFYYHYHPTRNHTGYKSVHIWFKGGIQFYE